MSKLKSIKSGDTGSPAVSGSFMFGVTIFLSAFLLFLIQPMFSKFILPWYGGSPAVWTTCMLFFQTLLLIGYAYAHLLTRVSSVRTQVIIHVSLLLISLLQLPPIPAETWKLQAASEPVFGILKMLFVTLGLPYVMLSATSPLLQRWFGLVNPRTSPYRLYALSNVGSLLALLSFPFFIEPKFSRIEQANGWALGVGAFVLSCGIVCYMFKRYNPSPPKSEKETSKESSAPLFSRLMWILLPAVASAFLLATTNKVTQEIVVIPLLWIVPLALYLVSFIICFDKPRWYSRPVFVSLFVLFFGAAVWFLADESEMPLLPVLTVFPGLLFIVCMICHGEVVKLKPHPSQLTSFYLFVALGGVIGSIFVVIIAPLIFNNYLEYQIGILATVILLAVVFFTDTHSKLYHGRPYWAWSLIFIFIVGCGVLFQLSIKQSQKNMVTRERSFYGMLTVNQYDFDDSTLNLRSMEHGLILHGTQFLDSAYTHLPTTYYSFESGLGLCMMHYPRTDSVRIGAVGLGVGTVAAWCDSDTYMRIYEINPRVVSLAEKYFTFLKDAKGKVDIVMGDARLSMEQEVSQQFDIIILDAFNSDSPPIHLLTEEAFQIYRRHLKEDGVIAVHISSKHLDYYPVIAAIAERLSMFQIYIRDENPNSEIYRMKSSWMLVTNNAAFLNTPEIIKASSYFPGKNTVDPWTDENSSIFPIFIW